MSRSGVAQQGQWAGPPVEVIGERHVDAVLGGEVVGAVED